MAAPAAGSAAAWAEEAREEAAREASLAAAATDAAAATSALPDLAFPFTAAADLIELRVALRELDQEWQKKEVVEAPADEVKHERPERRADHIPPNCLREHRRDINMNDWYALLSTPRVARESDCKFICAKGNAKKWCVESVFSTEDNGSCRLFAASNQKTHTNMNNWNRGTGSPPRLARESDCTFLCLEGSAKAWCVESEFSPNSEGSCRLSSCKATPFESESGDRRSNYLLGQARRRKRYVVAVLAFASPFVLFGLAWACLPSQTRRGLYDRLLGAKKAKSSL